MNKKIALLLLGLMFFAMAASGCAVHHHHRYLQAQTKSSKSVSRDQSGFAQKFFMKGKEAYYGCRFEDSIKQLEKAVLYESSNTKKANYLIFIGADWFYLEKIPFAKNSFTRAKAYSKEVRPSKTEFPFEIIKLYNESP